MTSDTRTIAYIDGSYLRRMSEALHFKVDFDRLRLYLAQEFSLVRCVFFCASRVDDKGAEPLRSLLSYLEYNGYTVLSKDYRGEDNWKHAMCYIQICLAISALEMSRLVGNVVFLTGEEFYVPLVEATKRSGASVTMIGYFRDKRNMSNLLRKQADRFIELSDPEVIGRISENASKNFVQ